MIEIKGYSKNYYERHGYDIDRCQFCDKIVSISSTEKPIHGPSVSNDMWCDCKSWRRNACGVEG